MMLPSSSCVSGFWGLSRFALSQLGLVLSSVIGYRALI